MNIELLEEELGRIRDKNLYRRLKSLKYIDSTHAEWEGKSLTLFCGNDYLGLTRHPRVLKAARAALEEYGIGAGSARLISGTSTIHTQLEEKIAAIKGKEKGLIYSAGYLANVGTLTAIAGENDLILMDKLCHASLIDGAMLSGARVRTFPHKNYGRAEEILKKAEGYEKILLVSETVFSMDGDLANLNTLVGLKQKYNAMLILDDAHGTGVLGKTGYGALEDFQKREDVDVVVGTLSKAFGCLGGFVASSEKIIEFLINKSRPFIFATALPPVLCAAVLESIKILEEEPEIKETLWKNVEKVKAVVEEALLRVPGSRQGQKDEPGTLSNASFRMSPILPMMIGDEKKALEVSESLLQAGLLIPAIRTPTVAKGKARLRITVSAAHTPADIKKLQQSLQKS